jgi:hypothetical protein
MSAAILMAAVCWLAVPKAGAAQIAIVSPQHEQTVHDNLGNVRVVVEAALGDRRRIRLLLDGSPVGPDTDASTIDLEGIDRGAHTLQALLVDEKGEVLARSEAVTFYMWRASAQFPTRRPPPAPASPPPPQN